MLIVFHFICCLIISFLVWFIFGMLLLSPQFGILGTDIFGPSNTPVSTIVLGASVIGSVQGSLLSILVIWQKSNTIVSHCLYSFIASEICLFLVMMAGFISNYLNSPAASGNPAVPYTYQDVFRMIFIVVFWYVIGSVILLIPSIIIGFATGKILNFFDSK